jgi:DUF917 family protein
MAGSRLLNEDLVEAAVVGASILAGGGGGFMEDAFALGKAALRLGDIHLTAIDEITPAGIVASVAVVGFEIGRQTRVDPSHHVRAMELLKREYQGDIGGVISCEVGPMGSVNGWVQAAVFGLPLLDSPANGRGHPISEMGSMGLDLEDDYTSFQGVAGGSSELGTYLELTLRGNIGSSSSVVRHAAVCAGGEVAVVRNPVPAAWLRDHAAPGALGQALEVGAKVLAARERGAAGMISAAVDALDGHLIDEVEVVEKSMGIRGGLTIGSITMMSSTSRYEATACDEVMTLDRVKAASDETPLSKERLATFPDLIIPLRTEDGMPEVAARMEIGEGLALIRVPALRVRLGAGMRRAEPYRRLEELLGTEIVSFLPEGLIGR